MRADFEKHQATLLLYPSRKDVWRKDAEPARKAICALAEAISMFEKTILGTNCAINRSLSPAVSVNEMRYNDIWVRDTGLIPTDSGATAFLFNAWGGIDGLYSDWHHDSEIPNQMQQLFNLTVNRSPLTVEGGNLTTDGNGTLIAIRSTILNANRNPNKSLEEIERQLKYDLQIKKIIWLDEGLVYDETGGHVDNIAAFVAPHKVFLAYTDNKYSPQYHITQAAYKKLKSETDASGIPLEIIKVPLPKIFLRTQEDSDGLVMQHGSKLRPVGDPVQASYINFAFVNGGVIVPVFGDEHDDEVIRIFKNFFTKRKIISFPAREFVLGGGGIHCVTKNI